ncbi:MAG: radical SAM protein, partial [Planctomycetes bacterium]|nr:radical SAM protein [Planctomycetota bacterium]
MQPPARPSERVRRLSAADVHEHLATVLGPRYREYRAAWAAAGPTAIPPFPIHLDLELRDNCNQRCVFCPRNTDEHPDLPYPINTSAELDAAALQRLTAEAAAQGLWSINLGAFAEPLIHKHVFDIVRDFHAAGVVDSRIITNGLLLDRHVDAVFASGLVQLFVSIDAHTEATYARQRGPGHDRVVRNVLDFVAERRRRGALLPLVRVSYVVTAE